MGRNHWNIVALLSVLALLGLGSYLIWGTIRGTFLKDLMGCCLISIFVLGIIFISFAIILELDEVSRK